MRNSKRAAIFFAALTVCGGIARAELTPMAQSFTGTAPGPGGGQFFELYAPTINSSGLASFKTDINVASNTGIFRSDGTNIVNIARQGQTAPGAGAGTFTSFSTANSMNSAGQVAILGNLTGTSDASTLGVFRGDGTLLTRIARDKELAPSGGNYAGFSVPYINSIGQAAFIANVTGTTDGSTVGIYRSNGVSSGIMARDPQGAPGIGGGTFTTNFSLGNLLDSGHAIFQAGLTGTNDTSTFGIFSNNGTGATAIVRNRWAAPGGGTYSNISFGDANNKGEVAYLGFLSGALDGAASAIFRSDGINPVSIVRSGQGAPGGGTIAPFSSMSIGSGGQVAFTAALTAAPDGAASGIFRGDGISLESIVRDKQPAPGGGGGTFQGANLSVPAINATGTVAFGGFLVGTAGGSTDDYGIYLADPQEILTVARKGQSAFGSVINFVGFTAGQSKGSQSGFNDAGQVIFNITNNDGYKYVLRYTPEIHFRNASGGGTWDSTTNWTVGLRPQAVHDVFVDPPSQFGATVNGPVGNVATKSLTITGRNGGSTQLNLNGGGSVTVSNAITIAPTGSVAVQSGSVSGGSLSILGSLTQSAGTNINVGSLINSNYANLSGNITVSGQAENDSTMYLNSSAALTVPAGMTNFAGLSMDNATINGNLTNFFGGSMGAKGLITGTLTNQGTLSLNGPLNVNGATSNLGVINVGGGSLLHVGGIQNGGLIALNGGALTPNGAVQIDNNGGGIIQGGGGITINLRNVGGVINANGLQPLVISNFLGNLAGAQMRVKDGSSLNITNAFTNSGLIELDGGSATIAGGTLTNAGNLRGVGIVSNPVTNTGTLRAEGGLLTLMGAGNTSTSAAQIQVPDGATLLYTQGLATNAGTLTLTGGTFDNNNQAISNTGRITGWGSFSSGALTNNNLITFTGGFSTINANVTNAATRQIRVAYNPALFTGDVTNNGIFKNTSTTITFAGNYTENGTFISDPADNFFNSVNIGPAGAWVGGVGDRFFLSGDLLGSPTSKTSWQTNDAELHLIGGVNHHLSVLGDDLGRDFAGYDNNFAWGILTLGASDHLALEGSGAVYVRELHLISLDQISAITGNGNNIYYDLGDPANSYLNGQTYALSGDGQIAPVPEPASIVFESLTALLMLGSRRRKHAVH